MSELRLEFSIFAEPISIQLEKQGFQFKSEKDEERSQKLLHAWNMLRVHGIQTVGESDKSAKRLVKSIRESIEPTEVKSDD